MNAEELLTKTQEWYILNTTYSIWTGSDSHIIKKQEKKKIPEKPDTGTEECI